MREVPEDTEWPIEWVEAGEYRRAHLRGSIPSHSSFDKVYAWGHWAYEGRGSMVTLLAHRSELTATMSVSDFKHYYERVEDDGEV